MANHYLAGVGRALLFYNSNLIGVGKTYTKSTFSFTATPEEVRAGEGNALQGRFFHDSSLTVQITDAMFKLEYVSLKLGVDIEQGGLSVFESPAEGTITEMGGVVNLEHAPVAFDGTVMVWYKKPQEDDWKITTTVSESKVTIPSAQEGEHYCIKYFWQNENARQVVIPAQFNPSELHVILMHDLFNAEAGSKIDLTNGSKVGRLITDIPRLQLDPNMELNLTPTTSAPVDITGTAMAVYSGGSCEESGYYGSMTEEIIGADWRKNVLAIAPENGEIELTGTGDTETIAMRVVYANSPAQRKDNKNFTFTVDSGNSAQVGASTGIVTSLASDGDTYISVALTGVPSVEPVYVKVNVSGNA